MSMEKRLVEACHVPLRADCKKRKRLIEILLCPIAFKINLLSNGEFSKLLCIFPKMETKGSQTINR